jgi:uncharacterized damage-inducible protein DinB
MERNSFISFSKEGPDAIEYLRGILRDARATTLERLVDVSQEELDWQYAEGWNSIGVLLNHFVSNDHYFRILFVTGRRLTDPELDRWQPGQIMGEHIPSLMGATLDELLAKMEESRAAFMDSIEEVDAEYFVAHRAGYNPDTGFNLAWALYHLAEDEIHHRGQISMIRKLYAVSKSS